MPVLILFILGLALHLWSRRLLPEGTGQRRWGAVFLLLFVPCLASTFASEMPEDSLKVCIVLFTTYWVGLALLHGLASGGHARLARWVGVVLVVWCVDGLVQWVYGRDLAGIPLGDNRVVGLFVDNLHLSLFTLVLMPLLLWPMAERRPWLTTFAFAVLSALATLGGARTAFIFSFLIAIGLFFKFSYWKHRLALVLLCLVPIVAASFSPMIKARAFDYDYRQLASAMKVGDRQRLFSQMDEFSSFRLIIWETAGRMLWDRPLLGVGPSAFNDVYGRYSQRPNDPFREGGGARVYHAHQMYVGMAAESGLVGLAGLLVAIGLCWRWYRLAEPAVRQRAAPFAASLALIAFPINSQPVLYMGWWFPIVLLLLCGMLAALDDTAHAAPVRTPVGDCLDPVK